MTSRLLLDTCAVIWMAKDERLSDSAEQALTAAYAEGIAVSVSPITAWELGLLGRKGRLPSAVSPTALFLRFTGAGGIRLEPLTPAILIDSSYLPGAFHNDPADRIIVTTARAFGLTVITRDGPILDYAQQGYVRAIAC